jgi:hypothetical protein
MTGFRLWCRRRRSAAWGVEHTGGNDNSERSAEAIAIRFVKTMFPLLSNCLPA